MQTTAPHVPKPSCPLQTTLCHHLQQVHEVRVPLDHIPDASPFPQAIPCKSIFIFRGEWGGWGTLGTVGTRQLGSYRLENASE